MESLAAQKQDMPGARTRGNPQGIQETPYSGGGEGIGKKWGNKVETTPLKQHTTIKDETADITVNSDTDNLETFGRQTLNNTEKSIKMPQELQRSSNDIVHKLDQLPTKMDFENLARQLEQLFREDIKN